MPDTAPIQSGFRVRPIDGAIGARIEGFDPAAPCDAETRAALNRAFAEYSLLVIPGRPMRPEETLAFAHLLGEPRIQLLRYKRHGDTPAVSIMESTLKADGSTDRTALRAEDWHTDDSYFEVPAKATLLHAIEIPSHGGSTWFCNMRAVYEALPEAMKARIDGLQAVHAYDTPRARNRPSPRTPEEMAETPDVVHPLVRTHPENGRKALYINFNRLDHIVGMDRAESDALLDELGEFARQPRFHFGHVWSVGDMIVWDNRCTMHRVMIDYPEGERRIMQRVLLEGERPV